LLAAGPQYSDRALEGLNEGINRIGPAVTLQLLAIDIEVSKNRYPEALARLDKIIARADRKDIWLVEKGKLLQKAGRTEEANQVFKAALMEIQSLPIGIREAKQTKDLEVFLRNTIQ
jgi:predicted Zn-dependent protease